MNHRILGVIAIIILIVTISLGIAFRTESSRINAWQSPLFQFVIHTFRSFRKLADLPYVVYLAKDDSLPTYSLTLKPKDIVAMNDALPGDMIKGRLTDEYKVKIKGDFQSSDWQGRISIRYRGRGPNHWNALKKSYQIDFPSDHPLLGYSKLKFNIPEDRNYIVEPLNFYRAKKLGLFAPQPWFAHMKLNGQPIGVYFVLPHWTSELTELSHYPDTSNIFGIRDLPRAKTIESNFFLPKTLEDWEDYTKPLIPEADKRALEDALKIISYAPDSVFEKALPVIVDMDSLYDWLILNTLAASTHQNVNVNIILLRDPSTGRFQPVPWDVQLYPYEPLDLTHHPLIGRTLAISGFREEFLKRLGAYVNDRKNLEDDLAFYDKTAELIRIPLFKDNAKAPLNWEVSSMLAKHRAMIIQNFEAVASHVAKNDLTKLFQGTYQGPEAQKNPLPMLVAAATSPVKSFITSNPAFYQIDEHTIAIGPGTLTLSKTTVLPDGFTLLIKPGTNLLLGKGVSLVGWKNVIAKGTQQSPIVIKGASKDSWGSLLIVGHRTETSEIEFAHISGGSGFHEYNIVATGMVALHNNNAIIRNSIFEKTFDDDALNIKHGDVIIENNQFAQTFGDAIDLDEATGRVTNNRFGHFGFIADKGRGPNGDGIDISFSTVEISHNIVRDCGDKGISVGEKSAPIIKDNVITGCAIGIAVKDLSHATIEHAFLVGNQTGLLVTQKKAIYGGGSAELRDSFIWNNKTDTSVDPASTLSLTNSPIGVSPRPESIPEFAKTVLQL
ncbi:MAG: CotH kinase family protein [Patescibacteria group bacterium]